MRRLLTCLAAVVLITAVTACVPQVTVESRNISGQGIPGGVARGQDSITLVTTCSQAYYITTGPSFLDAQQTIRLSYSQGDIRMRVSVSGRRNRPIFMTIGQPDGRLSYRAVGQTRAPTIRDYGTGSTFGTSNERFIQDLISHEVDVLMRLQGFHGVETFTVPAEAFALFRDGFMKECVPSQPGE